MKDLKKNSQKSQPISLAKYLLIIEGDINDGDYVTSTSIIDANDLLKVEAWVKCLKAYTQPRDLQRGRLEYENFEEDLETALELVRAGEEPEDWAVGLSLADLEAAWEVEDCRYVPYAPVDGGSVHTITEVYYYELVSPNPKNLI